MALDRRTLLRALAVGGAAALAGCSGSGDTTTTPAPTPTPGPTETPTPGTETPSQPAGWTPPAYVDQSAFTETTVSLDGPGDCSLGGALTVPVGEGPFPGIIMLSGSGPTDRDGTVGPNKPYKDLAWGLATQGVATLRYDDRTATCPVDGATITIDEEYTEDALTALARLREAPRVGPVGVAGHSLGGQVAPRVAARDGDLDALVMLAAPARSLLDLVVEQTEYLLELDGQVTDQDRQQLRATEAAVQRVRDLDIPEGGTLLGAGRPYWESYLDYDWIATARGLSVPTYLGQGARDYQVTVEGDLAVWRDELPADRTDSRVFEALNHLFIPGEGPARPQEYFQPGNVDEAVVTALAAFLDS